MLRQALWSQRGDSVLGSLLLMAHQTAEAMVPVMIGVIIDRAITTGDAASMARWIVALAVLFVGLSASASFGIYLVERAWKRASHEVRVAIARRVLDAGGGVDAVALPGEFVSLATIDAMRVGGVAVGAMFGAGVFAAMLVAAIVLLMISVQLGLVVLVGLPVVLVVVWLLLRPWVTRSRAEQAAVARAAGVAADLMEGLRILKGLGAESAAADRYRAASRGALAGALRSARVRGAYDGLTLTLSGIFLVVVAWIGGRLAVEGTITVGELVAAVGLTQFLVGPLARLTWVGTWVAQARASAERVAAVLAAPAAVFDGKKRLTAPARGSVGFRGVHHESLQGLTLEVAASELVGVVAPDPADAVALLACLARTVDPAGGEITLDGVPLPALALDDCRRAVLVAAHDADLFEGTLAENVAVAASVDVVHALAAAAADEVAETLPAGMDTPLAEQGRSLSGGQRQRIALARALATDPAVLVLHDPTTAVDAATEHRIAASLRKVRAGKTTIVVTTSPPLLAVADRVVLIEGGTVVAEGSHADLAAAGNQYRAAVLA